MVTHSRIDDTLCFFKGGGPCCMWWEFPAVTEGENDGLLFNCPVLWLNFCTLFTSLMPDRSRSRSRSLWSRLSRSIVPVPLDSRRSREIFPELLYGALGPNGFLTIVAWSLTVAVLLLWNIKGHVNYATFVWYRINESNLICTRFTNELCWLVASGRNCPNSASKSSWFSNSLATWL